MNADLKSSCSYYTQLIITLPELQNSHEVTYNRKHLLENLSYM